MPHAFTVQFGDQTRFVASADMWEALVAGTAPARQEAQFILLDRLAGDALATEDATGFTVDAEVLAGLDPQEAALLELPARYQGGVAADVHRFTSSPDFRVDIDLVIDGLKLPPRRRGPVIDLPDGSSAMLSVPLLQSLRAVERHQALPRLEHTEAVNCELVAELQRAQKLASSENPRVADSKFTPDLGALEKFATVIPDAVGLIVTPQPDGSLELSPNFGASVDANALGDQWRQIVHDDQRKVIRTDHTLVLLGDKGKAAVQAIDATRHIRPEDAPAFIAAPGEFLDPTIVDLENGLSARVASVGIIVPVSFPEIESSGLDWFGQSHTVQSPETLASHIRTPGDLQEVRDNVEHAIANGADTIKVDTDLVDISDRDKVTTVLDHCEQRLDRETEVRREYAESSATPPAPNVHEDHPGAEAHRTFAVGMHIAEASTNANSILQIAGQATLDSPIEIWSSIAPERRPTGSADTDYQVAGIEWMVRLARKAMTVDKEAPDRIRGALLADDMGLGKTYQVLVAIAEMYRWAAARNPTEPLGPSLAVLPASLLDNWRAEIGQTFVTPPAPYTDLVLLRGETLKEYRAERGVENRAAKADLNPDGSLRAEAARALLRVGTHWDPALRLDHPGRLILISYETLVKYQLSFASVDWAIVAFDEAQNLKNPTTLTSRAAKSLKSLFTILLTGTPVENSLKDFWNLIDTAQPGLLGSAQDFAEEWDTPMAHAAKAGDREKALQIGRGLRAHVGNFMLRREKEDHLLELPPKSVHPYSEIMPVAQRQAYDEILAAHRAAGKQVGAALKTMHGLSTVSLHPALLAGTGVLTAQYADSARFHQTLEQILTTIRAANEKVIVFLMTKLAQEALALWIAQKFGFRPEIVNGDTAVGAHESSRLGRIRSFEEKPGFNIIIMSPLAAGVGLNVVGANHVIHLERHWNPAKEAQATDRVYRRGQTRPVHVHYPIALHPEVRSFDLVLQELLSHKILLKDAVVVPDAGVEDDLQRGLDLVPPHL